MTEVTLRDGSRIVIRPVQPDDREAIADGFRRLSPETRYRRFFGPVNQLRERDLDYLTQIDHHDHEALVAVAVDSGEGIGVARFVRTEPEEAEPAIVVVDDWHGRGVATILLNALVDRAREEGITRFNAPILATNRDAIRAFERLGHTTKKLAGHEIELLIELPERPQRLPTARELLRQFGEGAVAPARTLMDLMWPRRRGAVDDPRRNLIVVGTDGSEHAGRAVEAAASLAEASGATVVVVGAHRLLLPDRDEVNQAVRETVDRLRERGLTAKQYTRRGEPALVLADIAEEERARLVVVGAGERSQAVRRLLGSTADDVANRSPCDVLIVRERDVQPS